MDVDFNFDDVEETFEQMRLEVVDAMTQCGETFVENAKQSGDYHDVSGNLRASNFYAIEPDGLRLGNRANYASDVEARGRKVCTEEAFIAVKNLKQRFT